MHRIGRKSKTEDVVPTMHNIPIYVAIAKSRVLVMAKYGACMSTTDVVLRRLVDMSSIWMHRRGRKSKTEDVVPTMHNIPIYVAIAKSRVLVMAKYGACMSTTDVVLRRLVDMSSIWMHRRGRKSKTEDVVPTAHNIPIYVINSKFRSLLYYFSTKNFGPRTFGERMVGTDTIIAKHHSIRSYDMWSDIMM
jgi:accessory colonization factor AcfC